VHDTLLFEKIVDLFRLVGEVYPVAGDLVVHIHCSANAGNASGITDTSKALLNKHVIRPKIMKLTSEQHRPLRLEED
jgi:hypothetical protein